MKELYKPGFLLLMRKYFALLFSLVLLAPSVHAAQDPSPSGNQAEKQMIRERLRALREERFQKMPYLDRSFVRSQIRKSDIENKNAFISSGKKTLKDLVERASQVYTKARASKERIGLEKRRILVALRNLFPDASFEFSNKLGKLSEQPFTSTYYSLSFKQPIFHGGSLWNTFLQKKFDLEAAKKDYESVMRDLVKEVSVAYFDYNRAFLAAQDQARALQEMKKFQEMSDQKHKEGIISEIENLNVRSLYGQMQYDYETAKQELELAKLELQKYLNLEIEDEIDVDPLYQTEALLEKEAAEEPDKAAPNSQDVDLPAQPFVGVGDLKSLIDMSYQNRPELQMDAAKLSSARLEEKIRFGELMPRADISLDFGKTAEQYLSVTPHPGFRRNFKLGLEVKWNLGGSTASYNLNNQDSAPSVSQFDQQNGSHTHNNVFKVAAFDGLKAFVDIKDAEVARLDRVVELEKKEKEVIRDVKQAYFDYQKSKIQVKSSLQRVDYRRHAVLHSKHKLDNNEVQVSEYMDAVIALLRDTNTMHKALSDYFIAKTKLNYAVGTNYFDVEDLSKIYE
jgi:outer membrane protein TolC